MPKKRFGEEQIAFALRQAYKNKALLRKAAARTVEALETAIAAAHDSALPGKCANYFKNSGYEPD